ncbi:hypothetical protein FRC00_012044 [Tulasnella sp. 408]|nr:hypothetical protein FRC00_012044 [Tulasnella sp. 408]
MFHRKFTRHTVGDIEAGSALWKRIHAVLNASANGYLTTREVMRDIRRYFPEQPFTKTNVSYSLSHSQDFQQVGVGGRGCRPWTLTGKSDGVTRKGVTTVSRGPMTFVRKFTDLTVDYLDSKPGKIAVWETCHAVLNASDKGCLSTKDIAEGLRSYWPRRTINRNTLNHTLSRSNDFKQVYLEGKAPGLWVLTGKAEGVNRTNAIRALEPCGTTGIIFAGDNSDDSDDDEELATLRDTPPTAELPYPSKTEEIEAQYSPDPTFSSPTLSPSLPASTQTTFASLPHSGGAVYYPRFISGTTASYQFYPVLENAEPHENPHLESHFKTVHSQEMASPTYPGNYTSENVFAARLDALSGYFGSSPPPYSVSNEPMSSNTSSIPNLTRPNVFLWNPNNVEPYPPSIPYLEDLGFGPQNDIGSFSGGTISTSIPDDDFVQEHRFGEYLGGWLPDTNIPLPSYSTTVTSQQGVPNAHHLPAYPTYMKPVQWGL